MHALTLPYLDEFTSFRTIGPDGEQLADINGRAAAIECYLDLGIAGLPAPVVRWTNFKEDVALYHGVLQQKDCYCRAFFERVGRKERYDTSKLDTVLDAIVSCCTSMATKMLTDDLRSLSSRVNELD